MTELGKSKTDREAVEAAIDAWFSAVNANDIQGVFDLACEDLEIIPPEQEPVSGPAAHQLLRDFIGNFTADVHCSTFEIIVSGNWAIQRYAYELNLTPKSGGESVTEKGHGIHLFRQEAAGAWKMAKDIYTVVPEL